MPWWPWGGFLSICSSGRPSSRGMTPLSLWWFLLVDGALTCIALIFDKLVRVSPALAPCYLLPLGLSFSHFLLFSLLKPPLFLLHVSWFHWVDGCHVQLERMLAWSSLNWLWLGYWSFIFWDILLSLLSTSGVLSYSTLNDSLILDERFLFLLVWPHYWRRGILFDWRSSWLYRLDEIVRALKLMKRSWLDSRMHQSWSEWRNRLWNHFIWKRFTPCSGVWVRSKSISQLLECLLDNWTVD